jgi:hypothetical protein
MIVGRARKRPFLLKIWIGPPPSEAILAVPKSLAKTVGNLSRYLKQISVIPSSLNGLKKLPRKTV